MAIAVLASLRAGESEAAAAVFGALVASSSATLMRLPALSPEAVASIVRRVLFAAAGAGLCAACHTASAGNPFLLRELLGALRAEHVDLARLAAEHVAELRPDAVTRAVLARLRELSDPARAVARAVAVLGGEVEPRHAAALADLSPELAARAGDELRAVREALELASDATTRAHIAFALGHMATTSGQLELADQVLGEAIERLGEENLPLVALLESRRSGMGVIDEHYSGSLALRLPRLARLAEAGGAGGRALYELLAFHAALGGEPREKVAALVEHGADAGSPLSESADEWRLTWAMWALSFIDDLDSADGTVDQMFAGAQARGSINAHVSASILRLVALKRGRIRAAANEALTARHRLLFNVPFTYACLGEALLENSELDEAGVALGAIELGPMADTTPGALFLLARGRVRIARGDEAGGIADLRKSRDIHETVGFRNPNAFPWRNALALALAHRAQDEAEALAGEDLAIAREVGQPRAIGVALRAQALIGSPSQTIELLKEATAVLQRSPARLEHARALADYGAALRRGGHRKDALRPLREALDQADRCGALAARAHEELLAAGARPRRQRISGPDALTASEHRVAQMAAQGMSNREIAEVCSSR